MLLNDEENKPAPSFPPALFVTTLVAAAIFVYLAFHWLRGEAAFGLEGARLRAAVSVAMIAFFGSLAIGAWVARRRGRSA